MIFYLIKHDFYCDYLPCIIFKIRVINMKYRNFESFLKSQLNYKNTELLHSESEDIGFMLIVELLLVFDALVSCLMF